MITPHRDAILVGKVIGREPESCQARLIHQLIVHPCCLAWVSALRRLQNRDISTNLTNGRVICRRSSPIIALARGLPRRPCTVQRKHSSPCPLWSRDASKTNRYARPPNGGGVSLWRSSALVSGRKSRRTAQPHRVPAGKLQAELSGIANVYSCCVPAAPFHMTCCHRQGGCIRTQPQAVLACGAIDLAEGATLIIWAFPR